MPELPEVTTTVKGLKRVLVGHSLSDVWTDLARKNPIKQFENTIKSESFFKKLKKETLNKKVIKVERRAKNILIHLEGGLTMLVHLKMTGHMIHGDYVYNKKQNSWSPHENERASLHDPYNRFVHVVWTLSNQKHVVFCDTRKFGKVTMFETKDMDSTIHLKNLGPEPLDKDFTLEKFTETLSKKSNKKIKTTLMDQSLISGIGNIYSDEMLWLSNIHPESSFNKIPKKEVSLLYKAMLEVLQKGIDFGGDSMSDYRDIDGKKGNFQNQHNAYRKTGQVCGKKSSKGKCSGIITRKTIDARSAHFCNVHQIKFI